MENYYKTQVLLYAEVQMLYYVSHRDKRGAKET